MLRHGLSLVATFTILCVGVSGAWAKCSFCADAVTVNSETAQCYLQKFDTYLQQLKKDSLPFVQVNLLECNGTSDSSRGLIALPGVENGNNTASEQVTFKTDYLLDEERLTCLQGLLENHQGSLDPSVKFDLSQVCKPGEAK